MPEQAHILDAALEGVVDHFVLPVDQRGKLLVVPTQPPLVAIGPRLQVKAQARGVGLPLHRIQPSTKARESARGGPGPRTPDWPPGRRGSRASAP